jgi:hypothetical protein
VLEKIMRPTSASQSMASSLAFLKIPFRRLEKVTCRLVELSIRRITIFPLPISSYPTHKRKMARLIKSQERGN